MSTIVITGASGFIGKHTVDAARARGHTVRAIVRRDLGLWKGDDGIQVTIVDLSADSASTVLATILYGADSVIHLASSLSGNDAMQARDTLASTDALLAALDILAERPNLVMASSLSVYGFSHLSPGATVDETIPYELRPERRDAYCRAKLAQEAAVWAADAPAWVLRLGAVFGPNRLWNAHLGIAIGPIAILFDGHNIIPTTWVNHAAKALVLAAEAPPDGIEIVNVIDDDLPDQKTYLQAQMESGWPRGVISLPIGLLTIAGRIGGLIPGFRDRLPGLFKVETRAARLQSMHYTNSRLHDRLGWTPDADFLTAIRDAIERSGGDP